MIDVKHPTGAGVGVAVPDAEGALRQCLCPPIDDIADAARLLDAAVSAHRMGERGVAAQLIGLSNMSSIWAWTDSIWGKRSPHTRYRPVPDAPPLIAADLRAEDRMPSHAMRQAIHERDGHHCRFCGIPVVRTEVRKEMRAAYPDALPWGRTNSTQHAAFQAMWAQYDHILPHARGGTNDLDNIVLSCAPCNFGRMNYTLDELGLEDPRKRPSKVSSWDGLERFLENRLRKGGETCEMDENGHLTNGRIMLELLGDEPDVSHTSLKLATELGMPDFVLERLRGKGRTPGKG